MIWLCLFGGWSLRTQELDSMICVGPFQICYDSVITHLLLHPSSHPQSYFPFCFNASFTCVWDYLSCFSRLLVPPQPPALHLLLTTSTPSGEDWVPPPNPHCGAHPPAAPTGRPWGRRAPWGSGTPTTHTPVRGSTRVEPAAAISCPPPRAGRSLLAPLPFQLQRQPLGLAALPHGAAAVAPGNGRRLHGGRLRAKGPGPKRKYVLIFFFLSASLGWKIIP